MEKETKRIKKLENHLKVDGLPGFEDGKKLNMHQIVGVLVTKPDPLAYFRKFIKNGVVTDPKIIRAVKIEMQRMGFDFTSLID